MEGHGSTVFISGEAGIGKTRLVEELKRIAESRGFRVLSGCSLFESLTPYMPFIEALKSGGLEHLFAEDAPRVEAAYLATHGGLMVGHVAREETRLNPDIFSSMLATVGDFVKESLSMLSSGERRGGLNTLGYENCRILVEAGRSANLVVILTGKENEFLIDQMKETSLEVDKRYGDTLLEWDGGEVAGVEGLLQPFIVSGKYDGIYYGRDDPRARRNLLFENVSLGLARHSQVKPVLLCIEDLQWADPSSLALMHYVARNAANCRLLALGTYRPEDVAVADGKGHPLVHAMQLMDREKLYEMMDLERLPRGSIDEFLAAMLGQVNFGDEFGDRVFKETEGNPLFMMQLVNYLVGERVLRLHEGVWRLEMGLDSVKIPPKIYNVISRRLERVEEEYRRTLDCASVIGETFASTVLAGALNLERILLLEQLKEIEHKHRLVHHQDGAYKFDHSKIKETLYDEISRELKVEYHLAVANSIEEVNRDNVDEVVEDLAFHYNRSKNRKKALHYLKRAAEKAKKEYSNEEAIRFYSEALELEEDASSRTSILENLGEIYSFTMDFDQSLAALNRALELATESKKKAGIQVKIGKAYEHRGDFQEAITTCAEAMALAASDETGRVRPLPDATRILHGERMEREAFFRYLEDCLKKGGDVEHMRLVADCLSTIGFSAGNMGDFRQALEFLGRALPIWEDIRDPWGICMCHREIGGVKNKMIDLDGAVEHFNIAIELGEKIGNHSAVIHCLGEMAHICMYRCEYDNAIKHFERALDVGKRIGDQWVIAAATAGIGAVSLQKGEYDRALEFLERSKTNNKRGLGLNYCWYAEAYAGKGDLEKAQDYCHRAEALSREFGLKDVLVRVLRVQGIICREQGKWEESKVAFESCIKVFEEMGVECIDLAEAIGDFALMWMKKGEQDKSIECLNRALDIYRKMKLDRRAERVGTALDEMQKRVVRHQVGR